MNTLILTLNHLHAADVCREREMLFNASYWSLEAVLSDPQTYKDLSEKEIEEAFLHASQLDWPACNNFYDGYKWITTSYGPFVQNLCRLGYAKLIRNAFLQHPHLFSDTRRAQLAGALLGRNNALAAGKEPTDEEPTDHDFVCKCIQDCNAQSLCTFSDGLIYIPEVADTVLDIVARRGGEEDKIAMQYHLAQTLFYDSFPNEPSCVLPQEKELAFVLQKHLPSLGDCCDILLAAGARVRDPEVSDIDKERLLEIYAVCFQNLTLQNIESWNFLTHNDNSRVDSMVRSLPLSLQQFFIVHPCMQSFPQCHSLYTQSGLLEELGAKINSCKTTVKKI